MFLVLMVLVSATQSIWAEFIVSRDETEVATGLLYFNIYLSLTEYWKKEQGLIGWVTLYFDSPLYNHNQNQN